jgi:hypothetical protein
MIALKLNVPLNPALSISKSVIYVMDKMLEENDPFIVRPDLA